MVELRKQHADKRHKSDSLLPGYSPPVENPSLDDQRSINRMCNAPDVSEEDVKRLMASTFAVRRQEVIKRTAMRRLQERFPKLFSQEQVSAYKMAGSVFTVSKIENNIY